MIKLIVRLLISAAVLVVIGVGLRILWFHQNDKGILAWKMGKGVEALERLKPIAYLGGKIEQEVVGLIYAYGEGGVPKNDEEAIYWFRRCGFWGPKVVAEEGVDPAASHALRVAKAYANGSDGVEADPAESLKWLKFAAKGGSKEAADMLAQLPH